MKRLGFLLLGLCLTTGVVATLGCSEEAEIETPSGEIEVDETTADGDVEEAAEEVTE